jgi:hypothetical protein
MQPGFEMSPEFVGASAAHAGGFEDLLGSWVRETERPQTGNCGQQERHVD